jgi:hypothetical protein
MEFKQNAFRVNGTHQTGLHYEPSIPEIGLAERGDMNLGLTIRGKPIYCVK